MIVGLIKAWTMWAFPGAEWPTKEDLSENRTGAWELAGNKVLTVQ